MLASNVRVTSFLFYYQFPSSDNYYVLVTPAIEQWKWPSVFKIKNPHLCDKYQLPTDIEISLVDIRSGCRRVFCHCCYNVGEISAFLV